MAGTEPKVDRELLGRVAALTPGQQRWLRTVLQSIFTMEAPPRRAARRAGGGGGGGGGEGAAEEEYPELADELKGIGDIADLLREGGRERRRFGEELMRLFGSPEADAEEGEEDEGEGARFN